MSSRSPHVSFLRASAVHEADHDPRKAQFVLHNCPTYTANALRRVLLSELVCPGLPNAYAHDTRKHRSAKSGPNAAAEVTDADGSTTDAAGSGVHIKTNTGRLHNEILRHRLAMLPIALDPTAFQQPGGARMVLRLRAECPADADGPRHVTSEDIQLIRRPPKREAAGALAMQLEQMSLRDKGAPGTGSADEDTVIEDVAPYLLPGATQLAPTDPKVEPALQAALSKSHTDIPRGILITRLYPEESLEVDLYPGVGCARHFAGYSPLQTCTYEQLDVDSPEAQKTALHDFKFTLHTLGTYSPEALFRKGLDVLGRKVRVFRELLQPRTFEIDFGSTAHPALHQLLAKTTASAPRECWVQWADVDFLTRLQAPDVFYQKHCHEVVAVTTAADDALKPKYTPEQRVPSVDGEDLIESTSANRHVLALHQPAFADTGVYEYIPSAREFRAIPQANATFVIAKEGRTKRARVFTKAEIVEAHDTRCVLRFGNTVPENIVAHIRSHIEGIVCAGSADGAPPVHLSAPAHLRPDIQIDQSDDATAFRMLVPQEDHTLGNLVQGWVYDRFLRTDNQAPHTAAAPRMDARHLCALGYKQPLPSDRTILFRAEFARPLTGDEKNDPYVSTVSGWLEGVQRHLAAIEDSLTDAPSSSVKSPSKAPATKATRTKTGSKPK